MANEITTEIRGGALIIAFNRPEQGNALSLDLANQLFLTLKPVASDRGIRAVMLYGKGGNFMNGLDMSLYGSNFGAGIERNNQLTLAYHSAIRELHVMEKPVLAMVNGHVVGPGLSFMLASDLVLAGRGTQFNGGFTSYAMTPDGGASYFLTRKVGAAKASEILMLSETFDAATAERLNLINGIVDDDKLLDEGMAWIDRLASGPTKAFGGVKRLVGKAFEQDMNTQLGLEHAYWGASSRSFDFREAVKAHFAKRPPKYTGA